MSVIMLALRIKKRVNERQKHTHKIVFNLFVRLDILKSEVSREINNLEKRSISCRQKKRKAVKKLDKKRSTNLGS